MQIEATTEKDCPTGRNTMTAQNEIFRCLEQMEWACEQLVLKYWRDDGEANWANRYAMKTLRSEIDRIKAKVNDL
jgi:hypothetical protein